MGILDMFQSANTDSWMGYFGNALYWLGFGFFALAFAGIIWWFWHIGQYNIKISLYDNINGLPRFLRKGRARVEKDKEGVSKMRIFGVKQSMSPAPDSFFSLSKSGRYLNLIKVGDGWQPFKISVNPGHAVVHDYDIRFWMSQTVGNIVRRYTELSFFQKYGTYIVFVFGMLVLGWMYWVLINNIKGHVDQELGILAKITEYTTGQLKGP